MMTHICYAHLASVRFEHSVYRGSIMTTYILLFSGFKFYSVVQQVHLNLKWAHYKFINYSQGQFL